MMKDEKTAIEFRFAGYTVNRSQQVLVKDDVKTKINTKAYYLLLAFLENHGKILTKDDLIDTVWPGQIVTDTALTKQIVRLRKVIGDTDTANPMIETHRGVGYRFTTPVEIHQVVKDEPIVYINQGPKSTEANKSSKTQWFFIVSLVAMTVSFYLFSPSVKNTDKNLAANFLQAGVGVAILPSNQSQNWLNNGGLDYLSQMLDRNKSIYTIKPRPEWYSNVEPEKLAVEISLNEKINYVFLVGIEEADSQVVASVKLRTADKLIASDELSAPNISDLLVKLNNWVGKMLLADKKINEFYLDQEITYDNYAMESYLLGVFHQEFNNDLKANEFYQAAVNKDNEFIQAWLQLADTNQRIGNNDAAISIAESTLVKFENRLNIKQLIKLNYIIAYAYFFKGDADKAQAYLSHSIEYIKQTPNPLTQLTAYDSLGGLAFIKQDWVKAEEYTLKRIEIAKDYYPFPNYIAAMDLILAEIYGMKADLEQSKSHLYAAMDYYEKINNSAGMVRAMVSMLTINLLQSDYDEGVALINKAGVYLENINNPSYVFMFLSKATLVLNLRGYFDRADEYLKQMSQIAAANPKPADQVTITMIRIQKYYVQSKFEQTKDHLSQLKKLFLNERQLLPLSPQYYLVDLLISSRTDIGEVALNKYQSYLSEHPTLKDYDAEAYIDRSLGHIYVSLGDVQKGIGYFKSAMAFNRTNKNISAANYIGFEMLEVMLNNPEIDYRPALADILLYTNYDYFLFKLKAQFLAREGNYFEAAMVMSENKQKANQLWKPADQLLLEEFRLKSKD